MEKDPKFIINLKRLKKKPKNLQIHGKIRKCNNFYNVYDF